MLHDSYYCCTGDPLGGSQLRTPSTWVGKVDMCAQNSAHGVAHLETGSCELFGVEEGS